MYLFDKEKLPEPILAGHEDWISLYYQAWEIAFQNIEYPDKPGWKPQLSCMPGVGIVWLWDSCFMTFITNYSNGTLSAFQNLDNIYRLQRKEDGYISMAYRMSTESEAYPGGRINPPILAWAEWQHYVVTGDVTRFASVIDSLEAFYHYIESTHRRSCGLYWFEDAGSSGMDNAPRSGYAATDLRGSDVCFIDLACQQALSAKCIASIHSVLLNKEKEHFYMQEYLRICHLINRYHWCEKAGYYFDFFARSSPDEKIKWIPTKTAAAFWTLLCECTDQNQAKKMKEHLFSHNEFYTPIPFASLSKDDPNYDPEGGYWLGSVWAPTNYVAIQGLSKNGYSSCAEEVARKYLSAMYSVAQDVNYGGIWECYCPEQAKPATTETGELVRENFVGWSGLAPITMLIETIIGLTLNAPENTITLRPAPEQRSGIRNLLFNGYKVSIICTRSDTNSKKLMLSVDAEKAFTLVVENQNTNASSRINVVAGHTDYSL